MQYFVIFSIILFSSLSYASFPFPESYLKNQSDRYQQSVPQQEECPNFHGTWKGACTNESGFTWEAGLEIFQICCSIVVFNERPLIIGGVTNEIRTLPPTSETTTIRAQWKRDYLVAHVHQIFGYGNLKFLTSDGYSSVGLKNGKLQSYSMLDDHFDKCEYDRLYP